MGNEMVIHNWANQAASHGKNGNGSLSYNHASLYSYKTEIARLYRDNTIAVYTTRKYSVTTSGKHQSKIPNAVSHLECYQVTCAMRDLPMPWHTAKHLIAEDIARQALAQIDVLRKAKTRVTGQLTELQRLLYVLSRLVTNHEAVVSKDYQALTTCPNLIPSLIPWLRETYGIDIEAKLEREREIERKRADATEAKKQAEALKQSENIIKWRNGEYHHSLHSCPVMLRINGEHVETSHGAKVPLSEAIALFERVQEGSDVRNTKIGGFTVTDTDDTTITIGCHKIPLAEAYQLFSA